MNELPRCTWIENSSRAIDIEYHDVEWCVETHDESVLFEKLSLEAFQSGLSWTTILAKRESFRAAFGGFKPEVVAEFGDREVAELLQNAAIVRHKGKIEATIANARAIVLLQSSGTSFGEYVWRFVAGVPHVNEFESIEQLPSSTELSAAFSKQAKKDGFRFLGPTTAYAFFQAAGLVNDHELRCFRHPRNLDLAKA